MAIIGNIYKLEKQLADKTLSTVFDYLKQALDQNSDVHKRIFNSEPGLFEKVALNDDIFAFEQVVYTKERERCFVESHKKYIDFQLILEGVEAMEYIDIDKLKIDCPYDDSKDLLMYKMVNNTSKFVMEREDLAIYLPDDAHVGLAMHEKRSLIYKVVVKLPVELF
jgi:YhcH/YjgK/YiaL family protein